MAKTEIETVEEFLRALSSMDENRFLPCVSDDIFYENVSLPPARGRKAFAKTMRGFTRVCDSFEVRMRHIAQNGPIVLTERTDILGRGSFRAAFWVCGTFEVRDEKIVLWRDYFDWMNIAKGLVRATLRLTPQD